MGKEPTLAYTVHHKGRVYPAGSTAAQIGPAATDIGEHAWVDGLAPEKTPDKTQTPGGTASGQPPTPTPSALPTPPEPVPAEEETGAVPAEGEPPRKATGRRTGNQG